jgi:hypothetical protein
MSLYLFNLGIMLALARLAHHIWWAHLGPRGRTISCLVTAAIAAGSYLGLCEAFQPISAEVTGIWFAVGLAGWFIPEILRAFTGFVRRLTIGQQVIGVVCVLMAIAVFQDANNARLIMTIIIMIGALWLIIKKGFKL